MAERRYLSVSNVETNVAALSYSFPSFGAVSALTFAVQFV
jgi:hypothetical protein